MGRALGVGGRSPWGGSPGWGRRSPGGGVSGEGRGAGSGAAEVGGGVSEGPARAQTRAPQSPGVRSPLFPRSHPNGRDEMRGGGAGLALLASLLWVAVQGQQRGEPGSRPGPLAGGRLRDKAPRLAAPEVGARIRVHP